MSKKSPAPTKVELLLGKRLGSKTSNGKRISQLSENLLVAGVSAGMCAIAKHLSMREYEIETDGLLAQKLIDEILGMSDELKAAYGLNGEQHA
jgi:hypothetical protein